MVDSYVCEIPYCYCCVRKFIARSELRVNSGSTQLTLKYEKMTKSSEKSNDHSLRALLEFRILPEQVFLIGIINIPCLFVSN